MLTNTTVGYCLSAAAISIASSILVVIKDTTPPLKNWMASLFGHHWTTHGVFVVVGFFVLGFVFSKINLNERVSGEQLADYLLGAAIVGSLIAAIFYLVH